MFYQQVKEEPDTCADTEFDSRIEKEADIGEWSIKIEEVDVSDLERGNDSDERSGCLPDIPSTSYHKEELLETVKTEKPCYECSACSSFFKKKRSLTRHITQVCFGDLPAQFESKETNSSTTSKTPYWRKMFECRLCKKKFDILNALTRHMRNHPESPCHKCEVCDKTFTRVSHRNRHMLSHSGQRNYSCEFCNKTYTRKLNCDKHRETAHSEGTKHEFNDSGKEVRNFECSVCHKAYKTNAQRNKHLVVHSDVRNFQCDICEKAFVKKDHLNVHMKIHNGIQSFECYVCCKTFLHCSARNRHMLIHTDK